MTTTDTHMPMTRRGRLKDVFFFILMAVAMRLVAGLPAADAAPSGTAAAARPGEPMVLTGAEIAGLKGIPPGELVAFRYAQTWQQIPVQVDERAMVTYTAIYHDRVERLGAFKTLAYSDAGTFTGPDPDPTLDADDEVVFMARDAGDRPAAWQDPAGVVAGSGVEVEITDPLAGDFKAYVYLFRSGGKLDPAAGKSYVQYDFKLTSGDYKATYVLAGRPTGNPEDSTVATACYTRHFRDRWISDGLSILAPLGTGVNLLDRDQVLFAPGNPARSILTFCTGEGAFVVNKSGPVRAIRSYIGCNSGPLSQRTHFFYDRREEIQTFARVHPIPGIVMFFDYTENAAGMTYANNNNPQGVTIDGVPDEVKPGALTWEMVAGKQGGLIIVHQVDTDTPNVEVSSYYLDEKNSKTFQVAGDAHAYGSSGIWVKSKLPNTDPRMGMPTTPGASRLAFQEESDAQRAQSSRITLTRIVNYEGGDATVVLAKLRAEQIGHPLARRARAVDPAR